MQPTWKEAGHEMHGPKDASWPLPFLLFLLPGCSEVNNFALPQTLAARNILAHHSPQRCG